MTGDKEKENNMSLPDVGKLLSEKVVNSVIGKIFNSSSFSLTTLGVIATAGAFGPIAPLALGAMWVGIGLYVLNETGRKWIAHKDRTTKVAK
jgi:hypothetical protein